MNYELPTTNHAYRRNTPNSAATPNKPPIQPNLSTNYDSIITNKANLLNDQMNVTKVLTMEYKNKTLSRSGKNKANSKPIKANLLNAQMNVNKVLTKGYENKSNWALFENKANTNPIQSQTNPILTPAQVNIIPLRFASQKRSRGGDLRLSQSVNMSIIIERVELLLQNNGVPESKGRF